jgi:transposase
MSNLASEKWNPTQYETAAMDARARQEARHFHSLPVLQEFKTWLVGVQEKLILGSPAGQTAQNAHNQLDALTRYCEDGDLAIENNAAEKMMKACTIGRRDWLFVASRIGDRRAAVLMGVINRCIRNQIEPRAYLPDLFVELPERGETPAGELLDQLLPER